MVGAAWLKARETIFVRIDRITRESGLMNAYVERPHDDGVFREVSWLPYSQSFESNNSQLILYPAGDM